MILNWPKHHLKWCPKDTDVHNRNGDEVGKATGTYRRCSMHGCTGLRIGVREATARLYLYPPQQHWMDEMLKTEARLIKREEFA